MIKHPWRDEKVTPNQWAKIMMIDMGRIAESCDPENNGLDQATDKERAACFASLAKQHDRVFNFLKLDGLA